MLRYINLSAPALLVVIYLFAIDSALSQTMELISGRWSHDLSGETLDIKQNFGGWEAQHSRLGQFSLSTQGQLKGGANLWMSGRGQAPGTIIDCYVFVNFNSTRSMTWSLREGPIEACFVGKFSKVPTNQEILEELAQETAARKATEARIAAEIAAARAADTRAKAEADRAASEAAEAKRIAEREKEKAAREANELAERAAQEREKLTLRVRSQPDEFKDVEIVYFGKDSDENRVLNVLQSSNIAFDRRPSENEFSTSILSCGPDVPIDTAKKLAIMLIRAGVKLKIIKPAYYPQFRNRITLEAESLADNRLPLTIDQIQSMESCDANYRTYAREISATNECPGRKLNVWVLYQNRSGHWVLSVESGIIPDETRIFRNDYRTANLTTENSNVWYYAESTDKGLVWNGDGKADSVSRQVGSNKVWKSLSKRNGTKIRLTCS